MDGNYSRRRLVTAHRRLLGWPVGYVAAGTMMRAAAIALVATACGCWNWSFDESQQGTGGHWAADPGDPTAGSVFGGEPRDGADCAECVDGVTYYIAPDVAPPGAEPYRGSDDNDGRSPQTAWRTFDHAWTQLFAGDTLVLLDGVYRQTLKPNRRNGRPGKPITIVAEHGTRPAVDRRLAAGRGGGAIDRQRPPARSFRDARVRSCQSLGSALR